MKKSSHVSGYADAAQLETAAPSRTVVADVHLVRLGGESPAFCDHTVAGSAVAGATRASVPPIALPIPELQELAKLFDLLSNETRLAIVLALRGANSVGTELCVCDLAALVGASPSMTSHQLRLLRDGEVVHQRRDGKRALYRLVEGPLLHLLGDGMDHAKMHVALRPRGASISA